VPEASLLLPSDASSVPAARHFVVATLSTWGLDGATWAMAQIVSELAANCALHARTDYTIRLVTSGDGLRLEVRDGSPARVRPRRYGFQATTGRGLRLVEALADAWGVDVAPGGKTVWVALPVGTGSTDEVQDDLDVDVEGLLAAFDDEDDETGTSARAGLDRCTVLRWAA
jgi:anti-sigma regulatory factor (Ser/Thr protein kinase)